MTFQVIVDYIDPKEKLPFDFDYSDEAYGSLSVNVIHSKRIRAKNVLRAIEIFQQKYPELEIIGWR